MTGKKILLMAALLMATAANAQVYGGGRANDLRTRHTTGARPVTRPKTTRTTPVVNQTIKTVRVNPDGSTSETTITNSNVPVQSSGNVNRRLNTNTTTKSTSKLPRSSSATLGRRK